MSCLKTYNKTPVTGVMSVGFSAYNNYKTTKKDVLVTFFYQNLLTCFSFVIFGRRVTNV